MLDVLWTSLGLFSQPKDTFEELKTYKTKTLFMNGFMISILGVLSLFLGEMLDQGSIAPHTVFFQLIAYYISSYLFLSIVLFLALKNIHCIFLFNSFSSSIFNE